MEKSRMVDATLAIHDRKHGRLCELCDLADEVRRLRAEKETDQWVAAEKIVAMKAEIAQLQTEKAELIKWGDGWKQQWTEMRDTMWKPAMDKLARAIDCGDGNVCGTVGEQCQKCLRWMFHNEVAKRERVEALLPQWKRDELDNAAEEAAGPSRTGYSCADEIQAALRDPQPSAAPTPPPPCWNRSLGCTGTSLKGVNVLCGECRARLAATGMSWPTKPKEPYNGW